MSSTATALPTGTWNVDPSHSRVGFRVKHLGISTVHGKFGEFEGQLVIGDDGTATASGTVQVASIDTADEGRDGHLKSPDFFDAEQLPEITFQSTAITPKDEDTYEIVGDLTMHGITKQITLTAEVGGQDIDPFGNERVGLEVTGAISRSEWNMKFNMAMGSGNVVVSDKVKLELDIEAVKASDDA
jgi:polyisoprenoid-binding protein YceI